MGKRRHYRPTRLIYRPPPAVYNQPSSRVLARLAVRIVTVEVETRMSAAVICTTCQRPLRVPDEVLGRLVQCPLCLDEFVAQADPAAEAAARAAEPPRRAAPPPIPAAVTDAAPAPAAVMESEEEPVEVQPVTEAVPARKAAPLRALVFPVLVTRDPDRVLRGRMDGELTADGLHLRKTRMPPAFAAVGGRARYLGGNRLVVTVEGREVELSVVKPWTSTYHLAKDTAAFLNGKGDFPDGRAYSIPWFLYAIPPLFIALPFAAAPFGLVTDGCLGAFLWTVAALVLGGLALAVALQSRLKPRARLIGGLGLLGLGALLPLLAIPITPSYTVDAALWRSYSSPNGDFTVLMPGAPTVGVPVGLPSGALRDDGMRRKYTVAVTNPDVQFAVFVTPAPVNDPNFVQPWFNQNTQAVEDAKQALQQEYGSNGSGSIVQQWPERDPYQSGRQWHEVTYRVYPGWNGRDAQQRTLVARIAVVNGKTYALAAIGPRFKADGSDMLRFFNSIQFTGSGKPVGPPPAQGPVSPNDLPGGGPLAYWSFDQGQLGAVPDDSGNITGTTRQTTYTNGKRGRAMHFNGRGSYFDFSGAAGLNFNAGDEFTFCGWLRTSMFQGTVLSNRNAQDGSAVIDVLMQGGALVAQVRRDGPENVSVVTLRGKAVNDGAWHHFALARDGVTLTFYMDGVQQGQANLFMSNADGPITTNLRALGAELYLQKKNIAGADFMGDIDEFCIFDRALDAGEVRQLAGVGGP